MPRLTRFHSFLDRFEERLQEDCELLKRQLVAQVDERFGTVRAKVLELRNRFSAHQVRSSHFVCLSDDPPVEIVSLDEWMVKKHDALVEARGDCVPSTCTGKRKSSSTSQTATNKRQKTVTTDGSSMHLCKLPGCGKSFRDDLDLSRHERIHLGNKPFFCTWPACRHSSDRKDNIVRHVRTKHFKLPELQKDQQRHNIVDNRNPEDYIRVDNQLLERRLE